MITGKNVPNWSEALELLNPARCRTTSGLGPLKVSGERPGIYSVPVGVKASARTAARGLFLIAFAHVLKERCVLQEKHLREAPVKLHHLGEQRDGQNGSAGTAGPQMEAQRQLAPVQRPHLGQTTTHHPEACLMAKLSRSAFGPVQPSDSCCQTEFSRIPHNWCASRFRALSQVSEKEKGSRTRVLEISSSLDFKHIYNATQCSFVHLIDCIAQHQV